MSSSSPISFTTIPPGWAANNNRRIRSRASAPGRKTFPRSTRLSVRGLSSISIFPVLVVTVGMQTALLPLIFCWRTFPGTVRSVATRNVASVSRVIARKGGSYAISWYPFVGMNINQQLFWPAENEEDHGKPALTVDEYECSSITEHVNHST
jgi:hypothetical protein